MNVTIDFDHSDSLGFIQPDLSSKPVVRKEVDLILEPKKHRIYVNFRSPSETGLTPDQYYGRSLRWVMDEDTDPKKLYDLLEEHLYLLNDICEGYSEDYRSDGKLLPTYTKVGQSARDAFDDLMANSVCELGVSQRKYQSFGLWDAEDWVECNCEPSDIGITPDTTREEIDNLIEFLKEEAREDGAVVWDLDSFLLNMWKSKRQEAHV